MQNFDVFLQVVGTFWKHLGKCGPAGAKLLHWTPALICEASQFTCTQNVYNCNNLRANFDTLSVPPLGQVSKVCETIRAKLQTNSC